MTSPVSCRVDKAEKSKEPAKKVQKGAYGSRSITEKVAMFEKTASSVPNTLIRGMVFPVPIRTTQAP
jgi:hypothetical protein